MWTYKERGATLKRNAYIEIYSGKMTHHNASELHLTYFLHIATILMALFVECSLNVRWMFASIHLIVLLFELFSWLHLAELIMNTKRWLCFCVWGNEHVVIDAIVLTPYQRATHQCVFDYFRPLMISLSM